MAGRGRGGCQFAVTPQITYFLRPPTLRHARATPDRIRLVLERRPAATRHPRSNRWTALRRSPRVSCERQSCQLIAEIRCATSTKAPPALWARLHEPRGQKQQRHLWQVMIPSLKIWVMAKKKNSTICCG